MSRRKKLESYSRDCRSFQEERNSKGSSLIVDTPINSVEGETHTDLPEGTALNAAASMTGYMAASARQHRSSADAVDIVQGSQEGTQTIAAENTDANTLCSHDDGVLIGQDTTTLLTEEQPLEGSTIEAEPGFSTSFVVATKPLFGEDSVDYHEGCFLPNMECEEIKDVLWGNASETSPLAGISPKFISGHQNVPQSTADRQGHDGVSPQHHDTLFDFKASVAASSLASLQPSGASISPPVPLSDRLAGTIENSTSAIPSSARKTQRGMQWDNAQQVISAGYKNSISDNASSEGTDQTAKASCDLLEEFATNQTTTTDMPFSGTPLSSEWDQCLEEATIAANNHPKTIHETQNQRQEPASAAEQGMWWGTDGFCYFDSADGWRYYWDDFLQQWNQHVFLGAVSAAPMSSNLSSLGRAESGSNKHTAVSSSVVGLEQMGQPLLGPFKSNADKQTRSSHVQCEQDALHQGRESYDIVQQAMPEFDGQHMQDTPSVSKQKPPEQYYAAQYATADNNPASQLWSSGATHLLQPTFPSDQFQPAAVHHAYCLPQRLPASAAAIDYSAPDRTHWRPATPFAKFAFGGKLLMATPSGSLSIYSLTSLPHFCLSSAGTQHGCLSWGSLKDALSTFPGPLTPNSPRDKVAAYVMQQVESFKHCAMRCSNGLLTLWQLLGILAQFQGTRICAPQSSYSAEDDSTALQSALAAALMQHPAGEEREIAEGGESPLLNSEVLIPQDNPQQSLARVQDLLLQGRRSEALREATQAQLWGIAMVISRLLGEGTTDGVLQSMIRASMKPESPLSTLCSLLSGGPDVLLSEQQLCEQPKSAEQRGLVGSQSSPYSAGLHGTSSMPAAGIGGGVLDLLMTDWRRQLAIIAANRTPGDEKVLERLGARLLQAQQVDAAHSCYLLAGLPLFPYDPPSSPLLVLVGAHPTACPRTYASIPAILRTEIYCWCRTVADPSLAPQYSWVLPYKLLHAAALADFGLVPQAAQYCQHIMSSLQSYGKAPPAGLLVCKAATADFLERLQAHAAAHKIGLGRNFSAGNLVSSMSRWLDKGITALIGGGGPTGSGPSSRSGPPSASGLTLAGNVEGGGRSQAHFRSQSFADATSCPKFLDVALHSRRPSNLEASNGPVATFVPATHAAPPEATNALSVHQWGAAGVPGQQHQTDGNEAIGPPGQSTTGDEPGQGVVAGLLSSVGDGLKGILGGPMSRGRTDAQSTAAPAPNVPENVFYYDQEFKVWRERGAPPPQIQQAPLPPPTAPGWQVKGELPGGPAPTPPLVDTSDLSLPRGGVTSRYVNTFAGQLQQSGGYIGSAAGAPPLLQTATGGQHNMQSMASISQPPASLQPLKIPSGPPSSICSPKDGLVPGIKFAAQPPALQPPVPFSSIQPSSGHPPGGEGTLQGGVMHHEASAAQLPVLGDGGESPTAPNVHSRPPTYPQGPDAPHRKSGPLSAAAGQLVGATAHPENLHHASKWQPQQWRNGAGGVGHISAIQEVPPWGDAWAGGAGSQLEDLAEIEL